MPSTSTFLGGSGSSESQNILLKRMFGLVALCKESLAVQRELPVMEAAVHVYAPASEGTRPGEQFFYTTGKYFANLVILKATSEAYCSKLTLNS